MTDEHTPRCWAKEIRYKAGAMVLGRTSLLGLSLCATAPLAHASEPAAAKVVLRWTTPAECPDDLALVRAIEGFLDQPLSQTRPQKLAIDARVQGDSASGYSAKLVFTSEQGTLERFLEHQDCAKLGEAVALLVAIAIDPERVKLKQGTKAEPSPEPAPKPVSAPAPAAPLLPSPAVVTPRRDQPAPRRRNRARTTLSLSALASSGALPSLAPGLAAELALELGHFEAGAGVRSWAPRSAVVPAEAGPSVELSLVTATLRLCGVPRFDAWSLRACARGDWGDMAGWGEGVNNARTQHASFGSLGGSLALGRSIGRLEPFVGAELSWLASRPRFGVLQEGRPIQAFRPRAWGAGGFIGLGYLL